MTSSMFARVQLGLGALVLALLVLIVGANLSAARLHQNQWRNATKRTVGSVVPRPKQITYTADPQAYLEIRPAQFEFILEPDQPGLRKCLALRLAFQKYSDQLLFDDLAPEPRDDSPASWRKLGSLASMHVGSPGRGFKCEPMPHAEMDESYELSIGPDGHGRLAASTNWGLIRGLETLSQLIFQRDHETFGVRPVQIKDEPRFKHRGFMLDTARHYISLKNILKLIDAMAYNKMNVFHWHLVDDQSFPLETRIYPQLAELGAFRPSMNYSQLDVQLVVIYAALKGIRVMPELDTPGHSYSMRHIPHLLAECYDTKTNKKNGDFGPIDPTSAEAYSSVDKLLTELSSSFVDSYFHAGGDEVDFDCWKSNPDISHWMASRNISGNYEELSNYYIRRLHSMVTGKHHKTMLVWQEVFDMGARLPNDSSTIIHVWKYINDKPAYMAQLKRVVDSGYQALLSSCWYLNYIDYGQDWQKFYSCDPRGQPISPERHQQVLGGEVCMWTEFVDDTNVVSRTWPRASAAAERLWSPADVNDSGEFLHRLEQHRCRLLARGIAAEPVNGPGYC